MTKLPWMPFYGIDFFESERVAQMCLAELGMMLKLLWRQWREGSLPGDEEALAAVVGLEGVTSGVLHCFPLCEDGRRRNDRLEAIRAEQEAFRQQRSEAGKLGALKRWHGGAIPEPIANDSKPKPESKPEVKETTTTTHARDARWDQLTQGMDALGQSALEGFRRAAHEPARLLGELEAVVSGLHGPGGQAVPVATLGTALHEMAFAGAPMRGKVLQAFVRRAMEPEPPARQNGKHDEDELTARMDRWAADTEAKQRAHRA